MGIYGTKNKQTEKQIVYKFIQNETTNKPIQIVKIGNKKSIFDFLVVSLQYLKIVTQH